MKVEIWKKDKDGKPVKAWVDTKKMSAKQRKAVELVENSMLRQWAHENKGACFVWAAGEPFDGKVGWTTYYTKDSRALEALIRNLGNLVNALTQGQMTIQLVKKM